MAAFDASTPNPIQEPNWLGWPKPTGTPAPDKSGETLGKIVGTAVEETGKIGGDIVGGVAESGSKDILDTEKTRVADLLTRVQDPNIPPPEVAQAQQTAETLGSAKANGAVSSTYYYGQLDKYASDLRSRFPMFVGQIDKGIAKATGVHNTANELYQSTLRDLNSFLTKKDDYEKAAQTGLVEMTRKGVPGAALQLQLLHSGKINSDQANDWVEKSQNHEYQVGEAHKDLTFRKAQGEDIAESAQRAAYAEMFAGIATMRDSFAKIVGPGYKDWNDLMGKINNPEKFDQVQVQQAQNAYISAQSQMRDSLNRKMLAPLTDRKGSIIGPSYAERMPKEWESVVDHLMKPMESQTTMIGNKEFAPAQALARLDEAAKNKMQHYFNGTRLGSATTAYNILKSAGADKLAGDILQEQLKSSLSDDIKHWGQVSLSTSWMTPGQVGQMGPGVQMHDLKTDTDDYVKRFGKNNGINMLIDDISKIQDSSTPDDSKIAKIKYAFGPTNIEVLSTWQRMGLGPSDLKPSTNGSDRWNILAQMLSSNNLKAIKDLDTKYPKERLWDTVSSTASTMIRNEIGKNVMDLNQLSNPNFQVTYNSDKDVHRFDINPTPGTKTTDVSFSPTSLTASKNMIEKINLGINRIVDIAKAEGRDPDAYIYQYFKDMGYDFSEKQPKTTGEGMMNALSSTYAAEKDALKKGREKLLEQGTRK